MVNSRLARRGGVKRISGNIYLEIRDVLKKHLKDVCFPLVSFFETLFLIVAGFEGCCSHYGSLQTEDRYRHRRKFSLQSAEEELFADNMPQVIFALRRQGRPIYGFDRTGTEGKQKPHAR